MIRKLAVFLILGLLMSAVVAGQSAGARTCRRLVVTIMDDPYFAHPICWDLPIVQDRVPDPPSP